jgi:hypothetical protein
MISYEPQADGTLKAISQAIPVAEFRALQEARAKGQEQQQAGLQVAHEALTYRGTGIGTSACIDLRTTWIYNAPDGWNHPENVVVGCFGAGPSGDWTGQSYLGTAFVSESQTWASAIRSIWTGSTYRVKLWTTRPVTYNTQVRANTGYPKLVIEHVQ